MPFRHRIVIVDCNNLGWRIHHGRKLSKEPIGREPGRLSYPFLSKIMEFYETLNPCSFVFCWDGFSKFRKDLFPAYKQKGEPRPEDEERNYQLTIKEFETLRRIILPSFGFNNVFHHPDFESDDLIAGLVKDQDQAETECIIVSNDHDFVQLLDFASVYRYDQQPPMFLRRMEHIRLTGIKPEMWALVMAITGCDTDKIPGVKKGVGEKTAIKIVKNMQTIDVPPELEEYRPTLIRNLSLVSLPAPGTPEMVLIPPVFDREVFFRGCIKGEVPQCRTEWRKWCQIVSDWKG